MPWHSLGAYVVVVPVAAVLVFVALVVVEDTVVVDVGDTVVVVTVVVEVLVVVAVVVLNVVVVVVLQAYPFVVPEHVPTRYALSPHSTLSQGLQLGLVLVKTGTPVIQNFQPGRTTE